jgi:hypothetical protein
MRLAGTFGKLAFEESMPADIVHRLRSAGKASVSISRVCQGSAATPVGSSRYARTRAHARARRCTAGLLVEVHDRETMVAVQWFKMIVNLQARRTWQINIHHDTFNTTHSMTRGKEHTTWLMYNLAHGIHHIASR